MAVEIRVDSRALKALKPGPLRKVIANALRKAGATAMRDMKAEAKKRIRARKRLKVAAINKAISVRNTVAGSGIDRWTWVFQMTGKPVPLAAYPHRQTRKGVSVAVNTGKRTLLPHAFVATMRSGHEGVFQRRGSARLPIRELLGSRPVDALLHRGETEAVAERGRASFAATFERLFKP